MIKGIGKRFGEMNGVWPCGKEQILNYTFLLYGYGGPSQQTLTPTGKGDTEGRGFHNAKIITSLNGANNRKSRVKIGYCDRLSQIG